MWMDLRCFVSSQNPAPTRASAGRIPALAALLAGLLLAAAWIPLSAQSAPAASAGANGEQVTLPVVVHDKHGKVLRNFTKDDLTLQVDGHPQTLGVFTVDTSLPMRMGLVVDTSMSAGGVLETVRNSSKGFLGRALNSGQDQAFILHYDRQVELLEDLTGSKDKLNHALDLLQTPQLKRNSDEGDSPDDAEGGRRGGKQLYDAIFLAADDVLKNQPGRRVMIVLSDGVDRGSKETLNSAIEAAQRANITIYAVYVKSEEDRRPSGNGQRGGTGPRIGFPGGSGGGGWPGGGQGGGRRGGQRGPEQPSVDGKKILTRISQETGGNILEMSKKQTLDDVYLAIGDDLQAQYSLEFTPTADARGEGYHRISLSTTKKDVFLQVRGGYYSTR
jgi:VWFA-related protein